VGRMKESVAAVTKSHDGDRNVNLILSCLLSQKVELGHRLGSRDVSRFVLFQGFTPQRKR